MTKPIRVLIVEDRGDDGELLLMELRRGGFDPTFRRVETVEAMNAALEQAWDVVISDWSMPHFSAMAAFAALRAKDIDLPFIIVSGTVGEEIAVEAMKIGVHDFMSKGHLSRLIPAIERELREVETRRQSRKMREQLVISERMASLGTLAAGIGHEVNNPLAVLIGNVEIAIETTNRIAAEVPRPSAAEPYIAEVLEALAAIQEAAERMRVVVRDLRAFSNPEAPTRLGTVDVRTVLESSIRMASTELRHRARVVRAYDDVARVEGSESQLGQVFLNLLVNAAQAIPEGQADANEIRIVTRMAGNPAHVVVEIGDTGSGIPRDVLLRIFDPFFTTKPSGVGTGLGLAICHRLVGALGGEIAVDSVVGAGTVFRIDLPAARPRQDPPAATIVETTPVRRGRVMVIDDEPLLRMTVQRMLQHEHNVIAVGSGKEALDLVKGGERFDVVLCDLMMPQMTGMDLYAEMTGLFPDQAAKMAFVTGGAFTESARAFIDHVPNASIEKPFSAAEIKQFVRNLLD